MLGYSLILLGIFSFWFSTGLTEGWKWRVLSGKPDSNPLIKEGSYHIWRLVTNVSIVLAVLGGMLTGLSFDSIVISAAIFVFGWALYEHAISFVEHGDPSAKRPPFRLLGKEYPRLQPRTIFKILVITLILLYAYLGYLSFS